MVVMVKINTRRVRTYKLGKMNLLTTRVSNGKFLTAKMGEPTFKIVNYETWCLHNKKNTSNASYFSENLDFLKTNISNYYYSEYYVRSRLGLKNRRFF